MYTVFHLAYLRISIPASIIIMHGNVPYVRLGYLDLRVIRIEIFIINLDMAGINGGWLPISDHFPQL